jgi:hypothetical protein
MSVSVDGPSLLAFEYIAKCFVYLLHQLGKPQRQLKSIVLTTALNSDMMTSMYTEAWGL